MREQNIRLKIFISSVQKEFAALKEGSLSSGRLRQNLALTHRQTFRENYLHPALKAGYIEMTLPGKPSSRLQKYRLTDKGRAFLDTSIPK